MVWCLMAQSFEAIFKLLKRLQALPRESKVLHSSTAVLRRSRSDSERRTPTAKTPQSDAASLFRDRLSAITPQEGLVPSLESLPCLSKWSRRTSRTVEEGRFLWGQVFPGLKCVRSVGSVFEGSLHRSVRMRGPWLTSTREPVEQAEYA